MKRQNQTIKCSECEYCNGLCPVRNTRTEFTCIHPDQSYIKDYFNKKRINKMPAFIGFSARYSDVVPIKTAPAWCPKKKSSEKNESGTRQKQPGDAVDAVSPFFIPKHKIQYFVIDLFYILCYHKFVIEFCAISERKAHAV